MTLTKLKLHLQSSALLCALCVLCGSLTGCVTITPASADRSVTVVMPDPLPERAWPDRHPEPLDAIMRAAEEDDANDGGKSLRRQIDRILGYQNTALSHRVLGRGVVCEVPPAKGSSDRQFIYITNRIPEDDFEKIMSYQRPTRIEREELLRWYFRLETPSAAKFPMPRGLILHLTSIGDRRFERSVSTHLKDNGWAILHVEPGRFHIPMLIDDNGASGRTLIEASKLAANLDEYAADYAYAVEGVLAHLSEIEPGVPQSPFVITGYSAGSLALPTIAALLDDKVDAAVFVGGGANVAGILIDSKLTTLVKRVKESRDVAEMNELRTLPERYLAESRFDPFHTARYLADKPVLMLHAQMDQIVPGKYGDLLYERLGRPERWSYPIGHIFLFWALPSQKQSIVNWIDRATSSRMAQQ